MTDQVDLEDLEVLLATCEERADARVCGQLRVTLAKALRAERDKFRRARICSMLRRVEATLTRPRESRT
jgi:hypothetical protein